LTERILADLRGQVAELRLLPSRGGAFEVSLNGQLIFSKKQLGRFPSHEEIVALLPRQ
jgi:selenoprotein W-related protein